MSEAVTVAPASPPGPTSCWWLRPEPAGGSWLLPGCAALLGWLRRQPIRSLAIHLHNSPVFAGLLQAAPVCGVALVLLHRRWSPTEAGPRALASGADAVLSDAEEDWCLPRLELPPDGMGTAVPSRSPLPESAVGTAVTVFTSGSSAEPRAVRLDWACIRQSAQRSAAAIGLSPVRPWLACLPLDHIAGAMTVWRSQSSGCPVRLHGRFAALTVADELAMVWGASLVPTMLHRVLRLDARTWPATFGCLLLGGGPVPTTDFRAAAARGLPPRCTYALTELAGTVAIQDPGEDRPRAGRPLAGVGLDVKTNSRLTACVGETGRVLLRQGDGPWLDSGDLGWRDERGRLHLAGRHGDRIACGGEKISLRAIEAVLVRHPQISAALAVALPDPEWGQVPGAALVAEEPLDPAGFASWLEGAMPALWRPRRWRQVDEVPVDSRGKPDWRQVTHMLSGR